MTASESWEECVAWFEQYAADRAYSWASFFPEVLRRLAARRTATGLYAHRWATTLVVSRYGAHPDWQVGPKIELQVLPGGRIEVSTFDSCSELKRRFTLREPVDLQALDDAMRFAAGEGGGTVT